MKTNRQRTPKQTQRTKKTDNISLFEKWGTTTDHMKQKFASENLFQTATLKKTAKKPKTPSRTRKKKTRKTAFPSHFQHNQNRPRPTTSGKTNNVEKKKREPDLDVEVEQGVQVEVAVRGREEETLGETQTTKGFVFPQHLREKREKNVAGEHNTQ